MEIIKNKLDKMESLYTEQWRRLSEIANNGNLDLLIEQTEALKKTYAKIVTLEVLYGECVGADANSGNGALLIPDVSDTVCDHPEDRSYPYENGYFCVACGEWIKNKQTGR